MFLLYVTLLNSTLLPSCWHLPHVNDQSENIERTNIRHSILWLFRTIAFTQKHCIYPKALHSPKTIVFTQNHCIYQYIGLCCCYWWSIQQCL